MKMMYRMYEYCGGQDAREQCTQDVRDYAATFRVSEEEALRQGMAEKSVEFIRKGVEVNQKA